MLGGTEFTHHSIAHQISTDADTSLSCINVSTQVRPDNEDKNFSVALTTSDQAVYIRPNGTSTIVIIKHCESSYYGLLFCE